MKITFDEPLDRTCTPGYTRVDVFYMLIQSIGTLLRRSVITYPKSLSDIRKLFRIQRKISDIKTCCTICFYVRNTKCFGFLKSIFRILSITFRTSFRISEKIFGSVMKLRLNNCDIFGKNQRNEQPRGGNSHDISVTKYRQ